MHKDSIQIIAHLPQRSVFVDLIELAPVHF